MRPIYNNDLPNDWEQRELRRLTIRKRGHTWQKEQESEKESHDTVPVIRIPNIGERLDLTDLLHLRGVSEEALKESAVSKDWILFVGSNGNPDRIGDSALMEENRKMVFASFLMGITSNNPTELSPEFLSLWLKVHNVHEVFSKTSQQTTGLANFCWGAVKKLPVRFPKNAAEQQAVVDLVRTANQAVDAAQHKITAAQRLKTALMQQLFTRGIPGRHTKFKPTKIGEIPAEWDVPNLGSLAKIDAGVALNPERAPRKNIYRYLTVVNVQREQLDLSEIRYLELWDSEVPAKLLKSGDIIAVEGHANASEIGRAAMVTADADGMAFQNHLFRLRLFDGVDFNSMFLLHCLNSERVRRHWNATANTSSGLNTINRTGLRKLRIPQPKRGEQDDIAALIFNADENIRASEKELLAVQRLKTSLLQNLLTGKVRVKMEN
ncbi:MAG TPA: restriction endonuclease subunit S [Verrucomicrobiae bacterium]|nr:restriction endonuclease subunit S [Verrucomicrobiae bacterium]